MGAARKTLTAIQLLRHLGPSWAAYRARHAWEIRSGALERRLPAGAWAKIELSEHLLDAALAEPANYAEHRRRRAPAFFFSAEQFKSWKSFFQEFDAAAPGAVVEGANRVAGGTFPFFSSHWLSPGFPPAWDRNPHKEGAAPKSEHFSRIHDFGFGDIKWIWEPSRFSWAYLLARAFARSGEDRYAETFWLLFEDWVDQNQPNCGPNWKCGQESALRLLAWIFAAEAFRQSPASTPARWIGLGKAVAVTAERIAGHIDYALSQRNNHGISEALGLFTAGLLFPELREATRWAQTGRELLERLGRELFYEDGAFSQHSFNYQRLALHNFLWAFRLADIHAQPFSAALRKRIDASAEFLFQFQDETTGRLPNCGHNDGALVLPLNNCAYPDFRPLLQACSFLLSGEKVYPAGPWDEDLLWLFGPEALRSSLRQKTRANFSATAGGYFSFRSPNSFAFLRCGSFRDRPSHADLLHFDLWWNGCNLAADPGSYSYNSPAPWDNALGSTRYHNTVTVDGRDQMRQASRFLWLPWAEGRVLVHRSNENPAFPLRYLEGTHNGYHGVRCRRGVVQLPNNCWVVLDHLKSGTSRSFRLHWLFDEGAPSADLSAREVLFPKAGARFQLFPPEGASLSAVSADAHSPRGWISRFYGEKTPALSFAAECRGTEALFISVFTPTETKVKQRANSLALEAPPFRAELSLDPAGARLVAEVQVTSPKLERLQFTS